jgi:spermidine/putrescine transport system ATP-binding protein
MSDTIVVMNQGYIQQIGTPEDIYNEPDNAYVAKFVGDVNLLDGSLKSSSSVDIMGAVFECTDEGFKPGDKVDVMIRPEDIELTSPGEGTVNGEVTEVIFKGVHYQSRVKCNNFSLMVCSTLCTPVGSQVGVHIDPFNIRLMTKGGNK